MGRTSSEFVDIAEAESLKKRFGIELNGIEYDAKFVFEYPGYQLEPSEMGAAFGLVQLAHFDKVKEKEWLHIPEWNQFLNNIVILLEQVFRIQMVK